MNSWTFIIGVEAPQSRLEPTRSLHRDGRRICEEADPERHGPAADRGPFQSRRGSFDPEVNVSDPWFGTADPGVNASDPICDRSDPNGGSLDPRVRISDPAMAGFDPRVGTVDPVTARADP